MPTSSPQSPKKRDPHHVLLMGPPGSLKTTILLQFPSLRVIDLDQNLDGPERWLRKQKEWGSLTYDYDPITVNDQNEKGISYIVWDKLLYTIDDIAKNDKIHKTIGIDGLTLINEALQRKVLWDQGKKSIMEPSYWGPFKTMMMGLMFGKLRSLERDVVVLCHETYITKPGDLKSGGFMQEIVTGKRPTINGGIADHFSGFFTDCWGAESVRKSGDTLETSLILQKTSMYDYKNSMGMPAKLEGPTHLMWEKIKPYWET